MIIIVKQRNAPSKTVNFVWELLTDKTACPTAIILLLSKLSPLTAYTVARYNTGNTIVLRGIRLCEIRHNNIIMINNRETKTNIPVPGTV